MGGKVQYEWEILHIFHYYIVLQFQHLYCWSLDSCIAIYKNREVNISRHEKLAIQYKRNFERNMKWIIKDLKTVFPGGFMYLRQPFA